MKNDNYQKQSLSNNFSTKPSYTSSENKKSIQNLDNNISYSQSDENENRNDFNNDNNYGEDEAPIANNYKSYFPNDNNYLENNNYNNNLNKNKFSKFGSVNEELNYNNQLNRGYSAQMNTQPRKTYTSFNSGKLQNNNYYQNYYYYKRTYSSDKNYRNNYNPSQNYRYDQVKKSNNMLISNYAPKNNNTKVIKIKKMPKDDINSSLKNKYYRNNNNYHTINNDNYSSSPLNQTAPNIPVQNYIKNSIRLPGTKIGNTSINNNYPNFNNNYNNNSNNNNQMMGINRNENYNINFDNFKGNNTLEYNSLRKPYSSNILNAQDYQRINSNYQPILRNQISNPIRQSPYGINTLEREEDDRDMDEDDDDDRFHNLSSTFNYLNRRDNFENNRNQPKNFADILKQPQPVIRNNPELSRKTIVKKLPPLSSSAANLKMPPLRQKMTDGNNNDINRPTMTPSENNTRFNDERNLPNYNYNKTPKITIRMIDSQGNPIEKNRMQSKVMPQNNNFQNDLPNNSNMIQNEPYNARFNPQFPQRQAMNAANLNRNYMPQNLASNTFINNNQLIPQKENNYNNEVFNQNQNKMFPRYNQNNYNDNNYSDDFMDNQNQNQNQINPEYSYPDPVLPLKENELGMEANRMEKVNDEDENSQNQNEINEENDEKNKSNVNISYNDFDDSGWIKNYGGVTSPGKNEKGEQTTNQDALVSITNINNVRDFNIFGILDGHGPEGQKISEYASEYIPSQITKHPEIKSLTDPEEIYLKLKDNNCQIITDAYLSCDEQLKNAEFDAYNSGCTCILVIHIGNHIICSNAGDSKGIVAYDEQVGQDEELNYLETAELSMVYRPEVLEERNRILMSGGIVEQMKNEYGQAIGSYRVWARGKNFPGLALSRSIGDLLGKNIGVIPDPGILEYDLSESTKFIAICSDGVWVYLNDEIVKNYGKSFYLDNNASGFCHYIVNQSVSEWEKNGPNVDDISVVVIFF